MTVAKHSQQPDTAALSTAGLKAAFNILEKWDCSLNEQLAILSLPKATYYKYRSQPEKAQLDRDHLDRISYLLNIHASLNTVFDNPENRYGFMRMKNHNPYFSGKTPMEVISTGSLAALYETFKRVDALRGAQW